MNDPVLIDPCTFQWRLTGYQSTLNGYKHLQSLTAEIGQLTLQCALKAGRWKSSTLAHDTSNGRSTAVIERAIKSTQGSMLV